MSVTDFSQLTIGETVVEAEIPLSRASLIDYAGASGDHNPIHWSERFATEVGLDGVIAHGMLSMAVVIAPVVEWVGDPGAIVDYRTRFSAPVFVPDAESGTPAT
ncbi:MAG: acyl dehydratase, partial [Brevibacterium sp.]|nr:acyl dehydratase [Brevibacterium sp.]